MVFSENERDEKEEGRNEREVVISMCGERVSGKIKKYKAKAYKFVC